MELSVALSRRSISKEEFGEMWNWFAGGGVEQWLDGPVEEVFVDGISLYLVLLARFVNEVAEVRDMTTYPFLVFWVCSKYVFDAFKLHVEDE